MMVLEFLKFYFVIVIISFCVFWGRDLRWATCLPHCQITTWDVSPLLPPLCEFGNGTQALRLGLKGLYNCTLSAVQFCWCLTILYIMFWIFSPTLISHIHPNSYLRNFVLSFILETIKSDQRCPGCMDNHWNLSVLPEATPLNNTSSPFPDSHHVQVAPQLGVALRALFHHSWWDFFFLI